MDIFYIELDKFKKNHDKNFLIPYADVEFKFEKRFYEYTVGRYLVKQVAQKYYNIDNTEIIKNANGKPVFKNANLHFSISHSGNIVIACFDKYPCGIDIEYMKERDLHKLSEYFDRNFETLEDFYKFWTTKEATYKIIENNSHIHSQIFKNYYYLTCTSQSNINKIHSISYILF